MRKFTQRILLFLPVLLTVSLITTAQKLPEQQHLRCGTMEYLEKQYNRNPAMRQYNEQLRVESEKKVQAYIKQKQGARDPQGLEVQGLTTTVYVPVVIHIVLPNADQVSDADVAFQIAKLNTDFAGLNADSSLIPAAFKPLFAKSKIQFKLARRAPNGSLTTGIERRNSATASNINLTTDPIKRTASGGLDAWDFTKYMNLWVGSDASGLGVLGYATFPGQYDIAANQGVFINAESFGSNTCYVIPAFGLGRTMVHEVGHYFGLRHIWGDESGCTGDDFAPPPVDNASPLPGCTLPAALLIGDTPNQAGETSGCPTGVRTDACSNAAPGIMYQNYMDYTNDACYTMFTLQQVARMEWVIENCRSAYLTSDGATAPPAASLKDVSPTAIVNPGGAEFIGCAVTNYAPITCPVTGLAPKMRVTNTGLDTITSFVAGLLINGVSQGEQTITATLPQGHSRVVTFPAYDFVSGTYTLKFYTKLPDNVADQLPANDTLTFAVTVGGATPAPIVEGFETTTFPPTGWRVINQNADGTTWVRNTTARNSGTASAYINLYNYTTKDRLDYLVSPALDVTGADSVIVSFARAYKPYSATDLASQDTLMIQISTDCGATFTITPWKKGGPDLASATGVTGLINWAPGAADWKTDRIDLKPFLGGNTKINVAFVSKNRYGQNIYLDDINIRNVNLVRRDATPTRIVEPFTRLCTRNLTPTVEVTNRGLDTIKTLKVYYSLNNGTPVVFNFTGSLPVNQATIITFPAITLPGSNNTLKFYTGEPNGQPDQLPANDTISTSFQVLDPVPLPLKEGFENASFPPANWQLLRSNATYSWERDTRGATEGAASAWIRNRRLNASGARDDLYSPLMSVSAPDSVYLEFDLAHVTGQYPGSTAVRLDSLEVLLTRDCGKTFSTVYKKWGEDLQTISDPNFAPLYPDTDTIGFVPTSRNHWRTEKVNLSSLLAGLTGNFQLIFRNINNNGNNTFLDNINIRPVIVPEKVKLQGYMISPNPSEGWVYIQHYVSPTNLKGIAIFNPAGQLIMQKQYAGNALSNIPLDLSSYAAGIYTIQLIYDNKVVTQRVVKVK
jgi:hypothetical protein